MKRKWNVQLVVTGVRKRDRTIKTHHILVAEFDDDGGPFTKHVAQELLDVRLNTFTVWSRAMLVCTPVLVLTSGTVLNDNARQVKLEVKRGS